MKKSVIWFVIGGTLMGFGLGAIVTLVFIYNIMDINVLSGVRGWIAIVSSWATVGGAGIIRWMLSSDRKHRN